ncbi:hypothetical protein EX30DRAFT_352216 [Ascodesmis nigricans]|uniref:Uncharacterized protein n=1 Tax=Ascodesmis nigricans TaxID=341454 RepID=A0A4S2MJ32_9PEZI|nr:hypothetical protein EX30DRAFT_352216 [Ascodesmis nigricans]
MSLQTPVNPAESAVLIVHLQHCFTVYSNAMISKMGKNIREPVHSDQPHWISAVCMDQPSPMGPIAANGLVADREQLFQFVLLYLHNPTESLDVMVRQGFNGACALNARLLSYYSDAVHSSPMMVPGRFKHTRRTVSQHSLTKPILCYLHPNGNMMALAAKHGNTTCHVDAEFGARRLS